MNPTPPLKPPAAEEALEFEFVDIAQARVALDQASIELAAESGRPVEEKDWVKRRRLRTATDRALTGATIDWLLRLPPDVRPASTCEQMPRLVNAIADSWFDRERCLAVIDDLLVDKRRGRQGLPQGLRGELLALRAYLAAPGR